MRILGIDPNSRGFGYAVLENSNKLIDWGVKYQPRRKKPLGDHAIPYKFRHQKYLLIVESLVSFYKPDAIMLEDWVAKDCRRALRIKRMLYQISLLAAKRKIASYSYSRTRLQVVFGHYEAKTKHDIAVFLSRLFPELLQVLPKKRKAWMSETVWMNMFTALAFCFVHTEHRG